MTRRALPATLALLAVGLAGAGLSAGPSYAANAADVYLVQGLPSMAVDVQIDGKTVSRQVKTTAVGGPYRVSAGSHTVRVLHDGKTVVAGRVKVGPRSSWDVVAHLPAPAQTKPVMTAYRNDTSAVPKDKASLTVAHTAAVPPADIRVNEKVLFRDVANGESLNLVVPVATYGVDIVPTGKTAPVYLGPLKLTVQGGSLNRVFAVGDPAKKTMNVAVQVLKVSPTGSDRPKKINTGTGGQAVGADPGLQVDLVQ